MKKQKKPTLIYLLLIILTVISVGTLFFIKGNGVSLTTMSEISKKANEKKADKQESSKPQILVSILPQVQIVEKIVADSADVVVLIPSGFSPATYEPTTKDIKNVSNADVYFRIGHIGFEETNLDNLKGINSSMNVVDTSANNELRNIEAHSHGEEEHEDEEHGDETDPHVWLSPKMVQKQAEIIKNTLVEMYPENKDLYEENYQNLVLELEDLDQKLADAFSPIKGKTMLVYHPAFGYLADEYGFVQEHIEIEGKEPSITELQAIINRAKEEEVRVIFVQKQFSKDSAQSIAENIGGVVVEVDPLNPDYVSNVANLASTVSSKIVGE